MTAIVLTLVGTGIAGSASVGTTGADGVGAEGRASEPVRAHPERCPDARRGLAFYRGRYAEHRAKMGAGASARSEASPRRDRTSRPRKPRNCADARYLARLWAHRAYRARLEARRWLSIHLLRDYPFGPGQQAWHRAVRQAQRVFPGTESWLLSCSAAEGGHGRWVGYGGQAYSAWLRDSDTVGGNLQFRWSTFKGMYRRALQHVRAHHYIVPAHLRDPGDDRAWRSALGQALAGAWARYTGNDDSHWSASWGRGC